MFQHCVWFCSVLTLVAHFSYSFSFSLIPYVASLEPFFFSFVISGLLVSCDISALVTESAGGLICFLIFRILWPRHPTACSKPRPQFLFCSLFEDCVYMALPASIPRQLSQAEVPLFKCEFIPFGLKLLPLF